MKLKPIEGIRSLPSLRGGASLSPFQYQESLTLHLAPVNEYRESLEIGGKLLMLSILNRENSLKRNKRIHDRWYHRNYDRIFGVPIWPVCDCEFAFNIRCEDMGLEPSERLRGIV